MKKIFIVLVAALSLAACQTADKKTSGSKLSEAEKDKAAKDSANYTTVEWLDTKSRDIGKVKEGRVVEVTYRFKNTGNKNLIITDVKPGCGCTVADKPDEPIFPGKEGIIKAKFDSKGQHAGEHIKYVYVTANMNPSPSTELSFKVDITD
jgi:predicted small secreted protein